MKRRDSVPELSTAGLQEGAGKAIKAAIPHNLLGTGDIIIVDESPTKDNKKKRKAEQVQQEQKDNIGKLLEKIEQIVDLTREHSNTKVEIKQAARELMYRANSIDWTAQISKDKRLKATTALQEDPETTVKETVAKELYKTQALRLREMEEELEATRKELDTLKSNPGSSVAGGREETHEMSPTFVRVLEEQLKAARKEIIALKQERIRGAEVPRNTDEELQEQLREAQEEIRKLKEELSSKITPQEKAQAKIAQALRERLDTVQTLPQIEEVFKEDWPKEIYTHTTEVRSSILSSAEERFIIVEEANTEEEAIIHRLESEFPGLIEQYAELQAGKFTAAAAQTKFSTEEMDEFDARQTRPKLLVVAKLKKYEAKEAESTEQTGDLIEIIRRALHSLQNNDRKNVKVYLPGSVPTDTARKILEYSARKEDCKIKIDLCVKGRPDRNQTRPRGDKMTSIGTFMIKGESGKTFAEALSILKEKIRPDEKQIEIRSIKEAKDGQIRIRVTEKTAGGKEAFAQAVRESAGMEVKTYSAEGGTQEILIKDLDGTTEENEIRECILAQLGKEALDDLKIGKPKKDRRGQWMTVVSLPKEDARVILSRKFLRIGWISRCRVKEFLTPTMCYNCQRIGHFARECEEKKTEKNEQMCYKCGQTGHKVKECKEEAKCYECNVTGHRASSMACPVYRDEVDKMRGVKPRRNPKITGSDDSERTENAQATKEMPQRLQQSRRPLKQKECTEEEWKNITLRAAQEAATATSSESETAREKEGSPADCQNA